jgi:hypothetical protein
VKAAEKLKKCEIVTWDWLDDSMQLDKTLPADTVKYSHLARLEREREQERRREQVIKHLEKAVREVNPSMFLLALCN